EEPRVVSLERLRDLGEHDRAAAARLGERPHLRRRVAVPLAEHGLQHLRPRFRWLHALSVRERVADAVDDALARRAGAESLVTLQDDPGESYRTFREHQDPDDPERERQ